jgi:hypothetical protein
MVLEVLTENVGTLTITPFLQLELLPTGEPEWGIKTNNNLIRIECSLQSLSEELTVTRQAIESVGIGLDEDIAEIRSAVENEAIERSAADAALQAQIPPNIAVTARFSGRSMTAGSGSSFTHNLGKICAVSVIREIGSGGVDVSNAFDTIVAHNSPNQVTVTVGITGTYTILCIT